MSMYNSLSGERVLQNTRRDILCFHYDLLWHELGTCSTIESEVQVRVCYHLFLLAGIGHYDNAWLVTIKTFSPLPGLHMDVDLME
jgi:hypothetical protein